MFVEKRIMLFIFSYASTAILFVLFDFLHLKILLPLLGGNVERGLYNTSNLIHSSILIFSYVAFSSLGSFLNWRGVYKLNLSLESERKALSMELAFLKNQFHSHLTFNFLNFCFSKMLFSSRKVADSIENFSGMLQYSFSNNFGIYIALQQEIDYMHNFIEIQKCISNNVCIEFRQYGKVDGYTILPMILAFFLENAFKHGVTNSPQFPIKILVNIENEILFFTIENNKTDTHLSAPIGSSLKNMERILGLFYRDNFTLTISETSSTYFVKLKLSLLT